MNFMDEQKKRLYDMMVDAVNDSLRKYSLITISERLEMIADYLLANGVLVPPCKVGDTVYMLAKIRSGHWEEDKYIIDDEGEWKIYEKNFALIHLDRIGKCIFLTREEAEAALKERQEKE